MSVPYPQANGDGGSGGTIGGGGTTTPTPAATPTPSPVQPPVTPPTSSIVAGIVGSSERSGIAIVVDRIPLAVFPAQSLAVQLGGQSCVIRVYQKSTGLYLDLLVGAVPIVTGALCRDRVWIVRDGYLGFTGDLAFVDTQGEADPFYTGLADRFQLLWGH